MSGHEEFPNLTLEARAACLAAYPFPTQASSLTRKAFAAFLLEAINQATDHNGVCWLIRLEAIAANLHNPSPPPPTLAQARAADLDTPEGKAAVRAFLATLGEGVRP